VSERGEVESANHESLVLNELEVDSAQSAEIVVLTSRQLRDYQRHLPP